MRAAFVRTLIDLARVDERIFLLVGDVGYALVEPFAQEFPGRFINTGVAEQDAVGVAAGLAMSGKVVFIYSLANFPTLRCVEQIRNDVCYHKANVRIVASGGGLVYGALGATHHATEDLAIMRALPNMTVIAPGDPLESASATRALADWSGPCYLRLSRTGDPVVHQSTIDFQIGRAIKVRDGNDATLVATGGILGNVVQAAEQLAKQGIQARVLSLHTVKPLDAEAILSAARDTGAIITVEEHSIIGGLGSAVAEVLAEAGSPHNLFKRIGLPDSFCSQVGNQDYLRGVFSLSASSIVGTVMSLVRARKSISKVRIRKRKDEI